MTIQKSKLMEFADRVCAISRWRSAHHGSKSVPSIQTKIFQSPMFHKELESGISRSSNVGRVSFLSSTSYGDEACFLQLANSTVVFSILVKVRR